MLPLQRIHGRPRLHDEVVRVLARRIIEADRSSGSTAFPKEDDLSKQLGVSRTVIRESMKVLADKGLVEMRPRIGTRIRPRAQWRLLDPDILAWQAEAYPDARFLLDLCEVRLAIEPTASGFAAIRATDEEILGIEAHLDAWEAAAGTTPTRAVDLDLDFHTSVVAASHNPLLVELSAVLRKPFRTALEITSKLPAAFALGHESHRTLVAALKQRNPLAARSAAEQIVGLAMLAVERAVRPQKLP